MVLLGREAELEVLNRAMAAQRPFALALHGEAGVGKTALIRAATERLDRPVHVGGALATLSWMPLLPVRRALGRTDPLDGDPAFVADEVRRAVGDGVLVVDDMHWADPGTHELLGILAGHVRMLTAVRRGDPGAPGTLEALSGAGFEVLDVEPLPAGEAAALVRSIRADLSPAVVDQIVHSSGGNPLLIEELAANGAPSESLRLAVAARLRLLPPGALAQLAALSLAGHPLPADALGPAGRALRDAGLVRRSGAEFGLRHALLGEVAVQLHDAGGVRAIHARLARVLDSPGEVARHHQSAGELAEAYRVALLAAQSATTPGERASHLGVAASCASGPDAAEMRLRAAEELARAGQYDRVDALLDEVPQEAEAQGRAAICRVRARWDLNDPEGAGEAIRDGLRWCEGTGTPTELELRLEEARVSMFVDGDWPTARQQAKVALARAEELGRHQARALYTLGTIECLMGDLTWQERLPQALRLARIEGDSDLECRTANNFISGHESSGDPALARRVAAEMVTRTQELHLLSWSHQFAATLMNLDMHAANYGPVLESGPPMLAERMNHLRPRLQLVVTVAIALADTGRADEAIRLVDLELPDAPPGRYGAAMMHHVRALALLEAGRPREALAELPAFLEHVHGDGPFISITAPILAWAAYQVDQDPPDLGELDTSLPIVRSVPSEVDGVRALRAGRYADAVTLFDRATELNAPYHRRGELRCRWAAAEAARFDGRPDEARERLLAVEEAATQHGMVPLLGLVVRSLRAVGVRRAVPRSTPAGAASLTEREREVLRLVGQGLSDQVIGRRLGISPRTVESQITAARRKLGAANRRQAAALAQLA